MNKMFKRTKYINVDWLNAELDNQLNDTDDLNKVLNAIGKIPQVDAVELDRDYWSRYYDIKEAVWKDDDGHVVDYSFKISYKNNNDEDGDNE